jgi:hypothetical protein
MKKLTTALIFLLANLLVLSSYAQTIRRVNNVGVSGAGIFTTLQAAHDGANSGDIIYLEPSGISYGDLNCTKPLTIIGNGFFHGEQVPPLTVDPRASIVGILNLFAGSQGSRITGLTVTNRLMVNANNCTVERNRIQGNGLSIGRDDFQTGASVTITSGLMRQNFIDAGGLTFRVGGTTTVSGVLISNNIIENDINGGNSPDVNSVLIANNIIGNRVGNSGGGIDVDNCVVKNNIVTRAAAIFSLRSNSTSNNVGTGTQFGTSNGNQQNVSLASIFGSATGTDSQYQIAVGGPADNTGESGVDCGAYGGPLPYITAGVPNVPTIFQYAQSISGTTLNATISTQSNR